MIKVRKRRYEPQKCNGGKSMVVWDNETGVCLGFTAQIVGRLNLQNDIINDYERTIDELKKKVKALENVV